MTRHVRREVSSCPQHLHVRTAPARSRWRRVGVVAALAFGASSLSVSTPSYADPELTLDGAKAKIERLNHEAELATEDFNRLREQIKQTRQTLRPLRSDVDRQTVRVERLRTAVVGDAIGDYTSGTDITSSASVLASDDPIELVEQFTNRNIANGQSAGLLDRMTMQSKRLSLKTAELEAQLESIRRDKVAVADNQELIESKIDEAQQVVDSLEQAARERLLAEQRQTVVTTADTPDGPTTTRSTPRVAPVDASNRAQTAIDFAMAQLGKPYVYGAAGPNSYDCSGLTMASWGAAGVGLSHYAPDQQWAGPRVSISQLVPGDLVFFYTLPSHVAIYLGNGMVIHSPHTGSVVQIVPMSTMPFHSATHIA